jgi:hypothetical protein
MRIKSFVQLTAISVFFILVSCNKERDIDGNSILKGPINTLNFNSIAFIPSQNALTFHTIAYGRLTTEGRPTKELHSTGWTHPSVLYFKNKWNKYFYWAALTPYPFTDSQYENPHIFCSNDGVNWIEPGGSKNPIEPCPEGKGFNSDVNLLLNDNVLYCYWRATEASHRAIYVKKSTDGVTWGEKKLVCVMNYDLIDVISPAFIKDEGKFYCYAVNKETSAGPYYTRYAIRRMISENPEEFNPDKEKGYDLVKIEGNPWGQGQEPWHLEVKKLNNAWIMLVSTTNLNGHGTGGRLFMGYSLDGLSFKFGDKPICNLSSSTYKSSFHPNLDILKRKINIEMWRASMGWGWVVFADKFSIKIN